MLIRWLHRGITSKAMAQYLEYLKSPIKSLTSSLIDNRLSPNVHKHVKQLQPNYTSYSLNTTKAINKKIRASERDGVLLTEYKVGNLVFTLQAGYYEMFKTAVHQLYNNHPDPTISCEKESTVDKNKLEVSFLYKVHKNNGKLYTINMYNTKCKILVNGKDELAFINDHLPLIQSMISNLDEQYGKDMSSILNTMIKDTLVKINESENTSTVPDNKCPICKQNVRSRAVQCQICGKWIHYKCERLTDKIVQIIETPNNVYIFRCKQCTDYSQNKAIEYSHENTHMNTNDDTNKPALKSNIETTDIVTEQPHSRHNSEDSLSYHSPIKGTDISEGEREIIEVKDITEEISHDEPCSTSKEQESISETELFSETEMCEKHIENTTNQDIIAHKIEHDKTEDKTEQTLTATNDIEAKETHIQVIDNKNKCTNDSKQDKKESKSQDKSQTVIDQKSDRQDTDPMLLNIIKSLDQNMTIMTECMINNTTHNTNTSLQQGLLDKLDTCATKMQELTSEITKLVSTTKKYHDKVDTQNNQFQAFLDKMDTKATSSEEPNDMLKCLQDINDKLTVTEEPNDMLKCLQDINDKLTTTPNEQPTHDIEGASNEKKDHDYITRKFTEMEYRIKILELQNEISHSQKRDVKINQTNNENENQRIITEHCKTSIKGPQYENTNMINDKPTTSAEIKQVKPTVTSHENSHLNKNKQISEETRASNSKDKTKAGPSYSEITKGYKTKTTAEVRKVRGKDDPLSNLYMPKNKIKFNDTWYTSSEQAYQSKKCSDHNRKDLKERIMNSNDTMAIMKLGQKITTTRDFKVGKRELMKSILKEKYQYSEEFRDALHQTGNNKIIEDTSHPFWGARSNGLNIHGKVLMEIRDNPPEIIHTEKVENVKPNTNDVLCLVDSNGCEIDYKRTWPYHNTRVRKTTTIPKACEAVDNDTGREPDIICIHTGTNDLISNDNAAGDYIKLTDKIRKKWPNAKLLVSKILPRGGQAISKKVRQFNNSIENHFIFDINSEVIDHTDFLWGDIPNKQYYITERNINGVPKPLLHLNDSGLSVLASKFKFAIKKL